MPSVLLPIGSTAAQPRAPGGDTLQKAEGQSLEIALAAINLLIPQLSHTRSHNYFWGQLLNILALVQLP